MDSVSQTISGNLNSGLISNKKGFVSFFGFIVFLISPLISLPFILYGIYKREHFSLFLLALFGGIITYMLHPSWELDLARYYETYDSLSKMSFSNFIDFLKDENDYLFYCIYYLFSLLGIHKFQIVLLILSTVEFYISFMICSKVLEKQNLSTNNRFILFVLFLLSLPILALISTTRFSIGYTFFMLYIYMSIEKKKIVSYVFLALAVLTHFAYFVYIPILFFVSRIHNKKLISIGIISVYIVTSILPLYVIAELMFKIFPIVGTKMLIYTDIYADITIPIVSVSLLGSILFSVLFFVMYYKYIPSNIFFLFVGTLLVVLIAIPFNIIIYTRFVEIFKPIFVITIIATLGNKIHTILKKQILLIISLFLYLPFTLYYAYTYVIYATNLKEFFSLKKILLVSILETTYKFSNFL